MIQYLCWEFALNWKKVPSNGNRIHIGILKLDLPEYVPVGAETVPRRFGILWDMHILYFYGTMHWKIWRCEGKYAQQKCHAAGFLLKVSTFIRLTPYTKLSLIILTKRLPSQSRNKRVPTSANSHFQCFITSTKFCSTRCLFFRISARIWK